jgi:hypothetical protein
MKVRHAPTKGEATERAALLRKDLELAIADADAAARKETLLAAMDEERRGVEQRLHAAERLGDRKWQTPLPNAIGTFVIERPATEVAAHARAQLKHIDREIERVECEGPPVDREPASVEVPQVAPAPVDTSRDRARREAYVEALLAERAEVEARIARAIGDGEDPWKREKQLADIDAELERNAA